MNSHVPITHLQHYQLRSVLFHVYSCLPTPYFLFLINLFILFIFGCIGSSLLHAGFLQLQRAGASLRCSVQACHCSGFSCCRAGAPGVRASVAVACGLQSAGSAAVMHRPSCSAACGILPDQGSNLCPLHRQADSQPLRHQGSPHPVFF